MSGYKTKPMGQVNPQRAELLDLDGARGTDPNMTQPDLSQTDRARETKRFFDRYRFVEVLGVGGMGEVRLYHDRSIGREVAMKVIRASLSSSPRRWRFIREARVQGQLEHPSVVPLYDLGFDPEGNLYFTMKRVRGQSLSEVIRELRAADPSAIRRWTPRRLVAVFSRVCEAVSYIHSRGVIHRDLKPSNVMLGHFGETYVLDWGIAKVTSIMGDDAARAVIDATDANTTGKGSVMGSPGYMAPEQLRGEVGVVDARSDIYSLGSILFEILTWERLHPQDALQARLLSVLQTDGAWPSQRATKRAIPRALDEICAKATRVDPVHRFESVDALNDAIDAYLDSVQTGLSR